MGEHKRRAAGTRMGHWDAVVAFMVQDPSVPWKLSVAFEQHMKDGIMPRDLVVLLSAPGSRTAKDLSRGLPANVRHAFINVFHRSYVPFAVPSAKDALGTKLIIDVGGTDPAVVDATVGAKGGGFTFCIHGPQVCVLTCPSGVPFEYASVDHATPSR